MSEMSASTIQYLGRFGMKEEEAEREFVYLQSHPPLLEYYYIFIRSLTGAAMASQCVFSQLVKDGREGSSSAENIGGLFSTLLQSSSLPGANMIGALCEFLGKKLGDFDRKKSIERLSKTFPSSSSLSCIEILGRQITLMQEDEIKSLSLSSCASGSASGKSDSSSSSKLMKKMTSTWKWLNNGGVVRNDIECYAEESVACLLEKIMSNDPSLSLDSSSSSCVDVMERLIDWAIEKSFKSWKKSFVLPTTSVSPVALMSTSSNSTSLSSSVPVIPPSPPVSLPPTALASSVNDLTEELSRMRAELQESRDKLSQLEQSSNQLNQKVHTLETSSKKSSKSNKNDSSSGSGGNGPMLTVSKPDALEAEAEEGGISRYDQLTLKIERLQNEMASVQKGLIQQESYLVEKFDQIDMRFVSLEKLNESLRFQRFSLLLFSFLDFLFLWCHRLNPRVLSSLKGLGVENQEDLCYVYSSEKQIKKLEEQLSPIDYDRFQDAKAKLFSKNG
jgi:hypothetical protein